VQFLTSARKYRWSTARSDLVAGATVAAIAIPQAIAYALIAGVDPKFGLYSAIIITIVASLLNSSSHLINGPTNAVSLVVFSALASFDGRFEAYQALFLLGIMMGIIQIGIAVLRLGDLTRYVSESVILGFMAGAGVLIALGQIGNFVGAAKKGAGDPSVLEQTWAILAHGRPFNLYAIGLGTGTILVVLLVRRLIDRYRLPKIDMLTGLIVASLVAAYFGWSMPTASGKSLIATVGTVPAAFPGFCIPLADLGSVSKSRCRSCSPARWRSHSWACSKRSPLRSRLRSTRASRWTITASASRKGLETWSEASSSRCPARARSRGRQ
jgi:SulP family sulfate permease